MAAVLSHQISVIWTSRGIEPPSSEVVLSRGKEGIMLTKNAALLSRRVRLLAVLMSVSSLSTSSALVLQSTPAHAAPGGPEFHCVGGAAGSGLTVPRRQVKALEKSGATCTKVVG
jgi:hypothetical protein